MFLRHCIVTPYSTSLDRTKTSLVWFPYQHSLVGQLEKAVKTLAYGSRFYSFPRLPKTLSKLLEAGENVLKVRSLS